MTTSFYVNPIGLKSSTLLAPHSACVPRLLLKSGTSSPGDSVSFGSTNSTLEKSPMTVGQRLIVNSSDLFLMGRDPSADIDILFKDQPAVSRQHLSLVRDINNNQPGVVLTNYSTTNGTQISKKNHTNRILENGCEVFLAPDETFRLGVKNHGPQFKIGYNADTDSVFLTLIDPGIYTETIQVPSAKLINDAKDTKPAVSTPKSNWLDSIAQWFAG